MDLMMDGIDETMQFRNKEYNWILNASVKSRERNQREENIKRSTRKIFMNLIKLSMFCQSF